MTDNASWYAHVTVATIVEKNKQYLLVYERTESGERYNQPAGHLEENESLFAAAIRETKEETGYDVQLDGLVRVNQYKAPSNGVTYIRVTFSATAIAYDADCVLDRDIIEARWMSKAQLVLETDKLRSPLVFSDIEFYENNKTLPLDYVSIVCPA